MDSEDKVKVNSYELSRNWFNFCFENPEKIKPNHTSIYFFAIEHCNRLGWKKKFGFPTTMVMEAIGIKSYNTYIKALYEIVDFGFIKMIEKSKNQHSANIIALSNFNKALDKALDKALIKHGTKQLVKQDESKCSVLKQYNKEQYNKLTKNHIEVKAFLDTIILAGESDNKIIIESFESWWSLYEKKGNHKTALERWLKLTQDERDKCFHVVTDYVKSTPEKKYRKGGEVYINKKAFNDEIEHINQVAEAHAPAFDHTNTPDNLKNLF